MKTGKWCVSANWGIYNHIVRSDLNSYREAASVAVAYKDRYLSRPRQKRMGRRQPTVSVWQLHEPI